MGDLDCLRRNVSAIADMAQDRANHVTARIREYDKSGGPFPERLPVILLVARFHQEQAAALQRWASWAEQVTQGWSGVTPASGAEVPDLE